MRRIDPALPVLVVSGNAGSEGVEVGRPTRYSSLPPLPILPILACTRTIRRSEDIENNTQGWSRREDEKHSERSSIRREHIPI